MPTTMMTQRAGKLIVISGPSGAGKTTLLKRLFEDCPQLRASVSATTRAPRPGEVNGQDYYFLSREEFDRRREAGDFLECFEVFSSGTWYGTLESEVAPSLADGKSIILEIDVKGTMAIHQRYPDAVTIFVHPCSANDPEQDLAEIERRLRSRGTESEEAIQSRLAVARRELTLSATYQHQVINDDVERAVRQIREIICSPED
jgi:guanylate kinase